MQGPTQRGRSASVLAWLALAVGVGLWLWPIGLGGRMPVGGDVTQFSMGLMAFLARSLRAGRLPVWNDLWGYGFPGLAESQMGVYYPPHWLFYGLFPLERAYTLSLVFHTALGAAGTYWAGRRFGVSPAGSALAGFAWTASGFFLIHLPHQWGYTVGAWMPWAWGLAWSVAQRRGGATSPLLLGAVLAVQILPGHFQLAFCTEVGVVLLVLAGGRWGGKPWRRAGAVVLALFMAIPLAAAQLWPTYQLARLASARRDYEYLSGFAASPLHLVSYLVPALFRGSPLWRPLVWDPLHTSPEEYLAYVGLVPLCLALGAAVHETRRRPAVRALVVVALATTLFGLGPYVPGFATWSRLPGFSFFRAPARWSAASGLALCLLAGRGFDAWPKWRRPGRLIAGFCILTALAAGLVVGGLELALASTEGPGSSAVAAAFQGLLNLRPWPRVEQSSPPHPPPREATFAEIMAEARQPQDDLRVYASLARQGIDWRNPGVRTFTKSRRSIYRRELAPTAALLVALLVVAGLTSRPRAAAIGLVLITAADLVGLGHQRPFDLGPIRPLTVQSPVLARLTPGTRTADPMRNLPMVAGAGPIAAYRTLDLPCLPDLTLLAGGAVDDDLARSASVVEALRASGSTVRVLDPFETAQASRLNPRWPGWEHRERINDPALAGWLHGAGWVERQDARASTFTLYRPPAPPAQAWLLPLTPKARTTILEPRPRRAGPDAVLDALRGGSSLSVHRDRPERLEIDVDARGSEVVIVSQLAYPGWHAAWIGAEGNRNAAIVPAFAREGDAGWQAIETPGPGRWRLRMEFRAVDVSAGLVVAGAAWLLWAIALGWVIFGRSARDSQGDSS